MRSHRPENEGDLNEFEDDREYPMDPSLYQDTKEDETESVVLNPARGEDQPPLESRGVIIEENTLVGSPPRRRPLVSAALSDNENTVDVPGTQKPALATHPSEDSPRNSSPYVEPRAPSAQVRAPQLDLRPNKNHPERMVRIGDGESLRQIAKRETGQENAWRQIAMDNNITNLKLLYVGMELKIVDRNSDPNFSVVYVHRGDTLASICNSNFGESKLWAQVVKDNGLASASEIFVGQPIYLRRTLLRHVRTPGPPPPPPPPRA